MDISKYPLEKVLHIIAGVIPGLVVLWIYRVALPGAYDWFWSVGMLGYRTKLVIVLTVALLIGTTVNTLVNTILYCVGFTFGRLQQESQAPEIAPWRDPTWRAALSKVLSTPPRDTQFWFSQLYQFKQQVTESLPVDQRSLALLQLETERLENVREDTEWKRWYEHYHMVVLQPSESDFVFYVQRGLQFNLETASLYALVSLPFVPGIRHWWCIGPALFWVLALVANEIGTTQNAINKWSTLDRQITYLTELARGEPKLASALKP
jgi:hypothetical protein